MLRSGGWLGLVLLACTPRVHSPQGPDVMVVEVGGNHESFAAALQRQGVAVQPPKLRPRTSEPPAPPDPQPTPEPGPGPTPGPTPAPPAPDPQPGHRLCELKQGQTIGELSREVLGTSRRYKEILQLNGLTEDSARKVRAGTKLKVPLK